MRRDAPSSPQFPHRHGETGLTLVEMIVVLAIIALVAALIVPNVIGRPDEARVTVANTDIRTISAALKMYRLDNGDYPTTEQGLKALVQKPATAPVPGNWASDGYLEQVPVDPWGRPYVYRNPGAAGAIRILLLLGLAFIESLALFTFVKAN